MTSSLTNRRRLLRQGAVTAAGLTALTSLSGIVGPGWSTPRALAQDGTPGATPASPPLNTVDPLLPPGPAVLGAPPVPTGTLSTAADAESYADVIARYAGFGTDASLGVFPRDIRHAMGVTTIPARPERVVVLDTGELDAMVQIGLIPVGTAEYSDRGLPNYITDQVAGVEVIGLTAEPDLEAIIALAPDLILSSRLRNEPIYDQLSTIAPTVFAAQPGVSFEQNFRLYCLAAGRETEGAAVVARYVERARQLNAALPATRPTVTVVNIRADEVRIYQRANFSGVVLTEHGFPRDAVSNVDDFAAYPSREQLNAFVTGDLIVLAVASPEDNPFADDLIGGDIWRLLPAVAAGNVLTVDATAWIGGIMYGAAFLIQDDLAAHFGVTLA